ncbi:hypothetical protein [Streptomyces sp. NPDC001165]|uniref:hypothetical protein n=1 Tax=Streptomyces sp. NPDC001165 TaxID=3364546 RepID=UPI0036B1FBF5
MPRRREETASLIDRRQQAHTQRFGHPMAHDNIWLRGRSEEIAALDGILLALDRIRHCDGTTTAVRGAGAPQRLLPQDPDHDTLEAP